MIPNNRIRRFWFDRPELNRPTGDPECGSETSFRNGDRICRPEGSVRSSGSFILTRYGTALPPADRPPSAGDIRMHAELNERLAALGSTRRGLWSKIWGFIRGD